MELIEKKLTSEEKFKGHIITVQLDTIELPDGKEAFREVVRHNGAVCIAAIDGNDVIMVEQYRYPIERVTLELCAGKLDSRDEEPFQAALRELREETGLIALDLEYIGDYYSTPGFCDEHIYFYLATEFEKTSLDLDDDEFLNVKRLPLSEAVDMVMDNRIVDGKTKALLLMAEKLLAKRRA